MTCSNSQWTAGGAISGHRRSVAKHIFDPIHSPYRLFVTFKGSNRVKLRNFISKQQ